DGIRAFHVTGVQTWLFRSRIGAARVFIALVVARGGLPIGLCLVNRRHHRTGGGVGLLPCMDGLRCKFISHGYKRVNVSKESGKVMKDYRGKRMSRFRFVKR